MAQVQLKSILWGIGKSILWGIGISLGDCLKSIDTKAFSINLFVHIFLRIFSQEKEDNHHIKKTIFF
jgi:hypothetical protein